MLSWKHFFIILLFPQADVVKQCKRLSGLYLHEIWIIALKDSPSIRKQHWCDRIRVQAPVVQRLDSTIHWINRYPVDKCIQNKSCSPLDSDLASGWHYPVFKQPRHEVNPFTWVKLMRAFENLFWKIPNILLSTLRPDFVWVMNCW